MNGMTVLLAGTLCFALVVSSCDTPQPAGTGGSPAASPAIVPAETVPSSAAEEITAAALAELGIPLEAPFGAENVTYSILSESAAQVRYTLDGTEYTFRGGRSEEEVSQSSGETDEALGICACGAYYSQTTTCRTYAGGEAEARWSFGGLFFSLYADRGGDALLEQAFELGRYAAGRLDEAVWEAADEDGFQTSGGAVLTVEQAGPGGLTFRIENRRAEELTYGEDYALYRASAAGWRAVPYAKPVAPGHGVAFDSIGMVSPDAQKLDWTALYGTLAPGEYRLVKTVSWGSGSSLTTDRVYADLTI